ncbi:IS200/IS605 family transposase (plasmid) [Citricoccus nitrophenolicus]
MATRQHHAPDLDRGRSAVGNLQAHLVFVTKYRRRVLTSIILDGTHSMMAGICAAHQAVLVEFNGESDHVLLLVRYPPTLQLSALVNRLKGATARHIRQNHWAQVRKQLWGKHFWSPSYFAASAGGAPLETIKAYIQNQNRPT